MSFDLAIIAVNNNDCISGFKLNIRLDISSILVELGFSSINIGSSLLQQFNQSGRINSDNTYFECISGDTVQFLLKYKLYSSQQIVASNKFYNSETTPILNTDNIKFVRPIQKVRGYFNNIPDIYVLIILQV